MRRLSTWAAIGVLVALHGLVILSGFAAPYDYAVQDREAALVPPTRIHFVDSEGHFHLRPFIDAPRAEASAGAAEGAIDCPVHFFVRGAEYRVAGIWRSRTHLFGVDEPARIFLMGTDQYGRDQFSRLLRGGQISLFAGLFAAALSVGIGLFFGLLAGFYGRAADQSLMRFAELFMVLPWLYLLLAVKAFLPLNAGPVKSFLAIVLVIGIVGWARPARLIRGVVLSAKERGYVVAAKGFGASDFYVLRRHILPQTLGIVLTQAALLVPAYSLSEMTLSFLGLGVSEPVPSWGNMLASLQQYHILASCWWMLLPAVPTVIVFWSYYTLANALQEPAPQ